MTRFSWVLLGGVVLWTVSIQAATPNYAREHTFRAVRFSYADLASLLNRTHTLVTSLNAGAEAREQLQVGDDIVTLTLSETISVDALRAAPPTSTRVRFVYLAVGSAPISSFTLDFSDFSRSARIEGRTPAAVDALSALVNQEISGRTTWFGGHGFRWIMAAAFWILANVLMSFPVYVDRIDLRVRLIGGVLLLLLATLDLFGGWFPGTLVYATDPSFAVQYAAEISLVGVVLAIVGIVLTIYFRPRAPAPSV